MRRMAQGCGFIACASATLWAVAMPSSYFGGVGNATLLTLMFAVGAYAFAYELWLSKGTGR